VNRWFLIAAFKPDLGETADVLIDINSDDLSIYNLQNVDVVITSNQQQRLFVSDVRKD